MMREPEEFYKIKKILTKEEWKKLMAEWLKEQQEILHRYSEIYLDALEEVGPEDREWYNERILALTDAIPHNLRLLKRAEIEGDYMIFYREDGNLAFQLTNPTERREIYKREKMRRRLIV